MALWVQKYGGTSMGSLERIRAVAANVAEARAQGHQVVVVVSAMAGETDRLIGLITALVGNPLLDPSEYAAVLASGESVSAGLLALALIGCGVPSRSFMGWQLPIRTEGSGEAARVLRVHTDELERAQSMGYVPVVAGFQGIDEHARITTLGRGGSDLSAVAIAAALRADECQIYTDVEGVYTCDPRIVPEARRLDHISFSEMLELSGEGAKVLQNRSVEYAVTYAVSLRVLSSFVKGPGTRVTYEDLIVERPMISGVAFNRSEARLTLWGLPEAEGSLSSVMDQCLEAGFNLALTLKVPEENGRVNVTFSVPRSSYAQAYVFLQSFAECLGARGVSGQEKVASVSLVGIGIRTHLGVASKMLRVLERENIPVQMLVASEIKLSALMDERYLELAARALHEGFALECSPKEECHPSGGGV